MNVGTPRPVDTGRRVILSAIWKSPVEGRVAVRGVNLEGVYAYGIDETRAWEVELGRDLGPGAFGENLTIEGMDVSGALLGERWRVGSTLLEVVQPRLPCFKLGLRFGDPHFVRRFGRASRPGTYLRIVEEGELGAGDAVEVETETLPDHGVTIRMVADAILVDPGLVPRVLEAPQLIPSLREWLTERYAAGEEAAVPDSVDEAPVVTDVPERSRLELRDETQLLGWLEYRPAGPSVIIAHTEVPKEQEGNGFGGLLVREALEAIGRAGKTAIPTCPFATAYLHRHPELAEHVAPSFRGQFTRS